MRDLRRQLVAVNASLDRQLRFARRGKPALAEAVDRAGVDPGLERLRDMLDRESVEQGRAAKRESTAADVSTVALLLAGGLVVFGLFLTVNRLARGHAIATRERRFRAMIERSSGVIAIVDGVGTLSSITGSPERQLGKAWSAMQGSSFLDHVHPRDRALANGYLEQARGSHGEGHRAELAMLHADGSSRSVELTGVDRTSDDDVRGVVLTVHDVSDRKAGRRRPHR